MHLSTFNTCLGLYSVRVSPGTSVQPHAPCLLPLPALTALTHDLFFCQLAGKRLDRMRAVVSDTWTQYVLKSSLLVLEVFRILTLAFTDASNKPRS